MTVEFRPTIKSINIASEDLTKITLEVKNGSLDGKYDELRKFSNKTVSVMIIPDSYKYTMTFDKLTNKPTQRYVVNKDGTIDLIKEEQTQLDVDGQGNIDIEERTISVDKDTIDDYILNAPAVEFFGEINPREVLDQYNDGATFAEIADYFDVSESTIVNELENARAKLAPYAHAWSHQKGNIQVTDSVEEPEEDIDEVEAADDPEAYEDAESESELETANVEADPY